MANKVVIAGGTGFIGRHLVSYLQRKNYEITILTTQPIIDDSGPISYVNYKPGYDADPTLISAISGSDALINLAGASLSKKWSSSYKNTLFDSRINSTFTLISAVNSAHEPPLSVISASAVGYYGSRGPEQLDEDSQPGTDFLSRLCVAWEEEAKKVNNFITRLITPRIGVVLGPDGGAFPELLNLANKGRGANFGDAENWMSWIHIDDLCESFHYLLSKAENFGVFNLVTPTPVRKSELQDIIARRLRKEIKLKAPKFLVRLVGGEGSVNVLYSSQYVVPRRLEEVGYKFEYEDIGVAIDQILGSMASGEQNDLQNE